MSVLPICITGEPVLHRVADPVESFDSTLRDLVADMIETMHAAPGVGLAAPQVGVGLQLFVWSYRGGGAFDRRYKDILGLNDGAARGYNSAMSGVVVNPTLELVWDNDGVGAILPTQPDMTNESEGCLSVPGVQYPLRRALGAILRGYDADGNVVRVAARGWLARVGYDPAFGARPLRRLIQREIGDRLAVLLLGGDVQDGQNATVEINDSIDGLVMNVDKP